MFQYHEKIIKLALVAMTAHSFLSCSKVSVGLRAGTSGSNDPSIIDPSTEVVVDACVPEAINGTNLSAELLGGDPCRPNDNGEGVEGYLTDLAASITTSISSNQTTIAALAGTVIPLTGSADQVNVTFLQTSLSNLEQAVLTSKSSFDATIRGAAVAKSDGSFKVRLSNLTSEPLIIRVSGKIDDKAVPIAFSSSQVRAAFSAGINGQPFVLLMKSSLALATRTYQRISTYEHSCAVPSAGSLKCWGRNAWGELGQGTSSNIGDQSGEMASLNAITLGTGRTVKQLAVNHAHTCALLDNATLKCWGENSYGQLGVSDTSHRGDGANEMGDNLPIVSLGTDRIPVDIVLGEYHTCAILDNGQLKCWGRNQSGQLGQSNSSTIGAASGGMGDSLTAINLGTGRTAKQVSAGGSTTCAILDNGTLKCWGLNDKGQLGLGHVNSMGDGSGEMGDALATVQLGAGRTANHVAVGVSHTCAVLDNGAVKCWGWNGSGQLGQESTTQIGDDSGELGDSLTAVQLGAGRTAKKVTAGYNFSCALLDNSTLKCWGGSFYGQLAQGGTPNLGDQSSEMGDLLSIVQFGSGKTVKEVSSGYLTSCAILSDDAFKCWGEGSYGQLGTNSSSHFGDDSGETGDAIPSISL